ncbi:YggU family protein [Legionella lytica]|uniref:UPF0235 protein J2N86_13355 n=1 Tax=Legionella lytica TaxID=96232 RepID=A0ABY4Y7Q7_9GAMM|nr:DUF167 domain-containing protein [Legionella lytica]USQ13647.1 YggU family protein [Legionella lytica]
MWYQQDGNLITINVYVQPGAKHSDIAGLHGEALKIRLQAPPIEGRANEALIKFIAHLFDVPARQVLLKRGEKSRHKTLIITGSNRPPSCIYPS